jgi:hypothetical protein
MKNLLLGLGLALHTLDIFLLLVTFFKGVRFCLELLEELLLGLDHFLLLNAQVLLLVHMFDVLEFFSNSMSLRILVRLHQVLKNLLLLQIHRRRLVTEGTIKLILSLHSELNKSFFLRFLQLKHVLLGCCHNFLFVRVPTLLKDSDLLSFLFNKLMHLNIMLCHKIVPKLVVLEIN